MFVLDSQSNPIQTQDDIDNSDFLYYDHKREDYYLSSGVLWYSITSPCYKVSIKENEIIIPETFHIIIGDYDRGVDAISVMELLGRDFEAITFDKSFDKNSIKLEKISITGYERSYLTKFPYCDNIVPVQLGDSVVLVSQNDCYNRIKHLCIDDFV
mgnify:CR=1 FL=1